MVYFNSYPDLLTQHGYACVFPINMSQAQAAAAAADTISQIDSANNATNTSQSSASELKLP
jgi:hypothetical protein